MEAAWNNFCLQRRVYALNGSEYLTYMTDQLEEEEEEKKIPIPYFLADGRGNCFYFFFFEVYWYWFCFLLASPSSTLFISVMHNVAWWNYTLHHLFSPLENHFSFHSPGCRTLTLWYTLHLNSQHSMSMCFRHSLWWLHSSSSFQLTNQWWAGWLRRNMWILWH